MKEQIIKAFRNPMFAPIYAIVIVITIQYLLWNVDFLLNLDKTIKFIVSVISTFLAAIISFFYFVDLKEN